MAVGTMMGDLARSWGWIVFRGIVAILFGICAFAVPNLTFAILVLLWGAFALADGLVAVIAGLQMKDGGKPMWPLVLVGLIGIAAGVLTFLRPGITELALLGFIAGWALLTGILQVMAAIRLRKVISGEWMLGLSGLLSILFGALMIARPGAGALAVVWIIGWYAILFGVTLTMLGFRLRGLTAGIPKLA